MPPIDIPMDRSTVRFVFSRTDVQFIISIFRWRKMLKRDRPDILIGALAMPHMILGNASIGLGMRLIGRRGFAWENLNHIPQYRKLRIVLQYYRRWSEWRTKYLVVNANHVAKSVQYWEGWKPSKIRLIRNGWPEYPSIDYTSLRAVYSGRDRVEKSFSIPGVERITTIPVWSSVGLYVHPTIAEGCSNSIGMAMAHGIPVVAYRKAGNVELLGSEYPALVDNENEMRRWITMLENSESTRRLLGQTCQERARTHYSLKASVDSWEGLLHNEAKERSAAKDMVVDSSLVRSDG